MADNSRGQKTERPTAKRLKKARDEGQVAKSQELSSAFNLAGGFLILYFLFGNLVNSLRGKMYSFLTLAEMSEITRDNSLELILGTYIYIIQLVIPIMLITGVVGLFVNLIQVGPRFIPKLILPKLSKLNPIEGAKRLFSLKSVIELVKSLAKAIIIGFLTYSQFKKAWPDLVTLTGQGIEPGLLFIANLLVRTITSILIFLIILGIFDYIYQRWEFIRNLRMSKQEVKDEYKEYEGDPQIKSHRRRKQRELSMNRMIKAVEEADVVITNPTHIAVALQFDIQSMEAPLVVAKGEGFIARKIKEVAVEYGVEIVENKPLARALNAVAEIGQEIPPDLYQAVAEVLAYIYRNHKFQ